MKLNRILALAMTAVCTVASTAVHADVDLSSVVEVIRQTPANNDFVLPSDSRFERKWQNFTKAATGNVRHNIGDAFVLIDTTVFGACDEGVLIDRLGITVQHDFSDDNGFISWTDFVQSGTVSQENDNLILCEKPKIAAHFVGSNFKVANARSFFDRLLAAIRNRQNNVYNSSPVVSPEPQGPATKDVNVQDVIFNKRIEKFGGYYLGGKIKLPDHCKNYGMPGFENAFDDYVKCLDGSQYRYYKDGNSIIQCTPLPTQNTSGVIRYTGVTPYTRLVEQVQLEFFAIKKSDLIMRVKAELQEAIELPLYLEEGQFKADRGRQLITFQTENETYNGNECPGLVVRVVDYGSIEAEKSYVQAQKDKQQNELQRWIDDLNSRPPFTSFCGISFGTRLTGNLERTGDGEYLYGYVKLKTPFRGCDTAKVYAGIKSHRIFRVELETKDPPGILGAWDFGNDVISSAGVLDKKYNPKGNPLINLNTYLSTIECYGFDRSKVAKERGRVERIVGDKYPLDSDYNLNGGYVRIVPKKVGIGEYYHDVEEIGPGRRYAIAVPKERQEEVGVLIATSYKYEEIANHEFEKESRGDGSGVL